MALYFAQDVPIPPSLVGMHPQLSALFIIANEAFAEYGEDAVVTSVTEGKHKRGSLHYIGCAADFRGKQLSPDLREIIRGTIAKRLGREWDVVLSDKSIHAEWQPKSGVNRDD